MKRSGAGGAAPAHGGSDTGDAQLAAGVAAAAAVLLATGLGVGVPEAKIAVGALHVLEGEVPYRDFWSMYAPGAHYAVAGLFAVFGRELVVSGAAAVALDALAAGVFALLLRRLGLRRGAAFGLGLAFAAAAWRTAPELTSYPPARLLLLASFERAVRGFQGGGLRALAAAGLCLSAAACFKHDVAAYAAAATLLCVVAAPALLSGRRPAGWPSAPRAACVFCVACVVLAGPAALGVALAAGGDAWRDLIAFPATTFRAVRAEPFPGPLPPFDAVLAWLRDPGDLRAGQAAGLLSRAWLLGNLPVLAFAAGAAVLLRARRALAPGAFAAALLALLWMPPFWLAAHVQQNTHLFTLALLAAVLGAIAWAHGPPGPSGRALRALVVAGGAAGAAGLAIAPAMDAFLLLRDLPGRVLELPGVRGLRVSDADFELYTDIGRFVRFNVPEDEPIHVGVARHDAVVINAPRFYAVAGRRSATRHPELHPGVTDTESVQREMIADLEAARVRCVILWHFGWAEPVLDGLRARYAAAVPGGGARLLDDHLRRHFVPVLRRGEHVVLWRRDAPPPVPPPGSGGDA